MNATLMHTIVHRTWYWCCFLSRGAYSGCKYEIITAHTNIYTLDTISFFHIRRGPNANWIQTFSKPLNSIIKKNSQAYIFRDDEDEGFATSCVFVQKIANLLRFLRFVLFHAKIYTQLTKKQVPISIRLRAKIERYVYIWWFEFCIIWYIFYFILHVHRVIYRSKKNVRFSWRFTIWDVIVSWIYSRSHTYSTFWQTLNLDELTFTAAAAVGSQMFSAEPTAYFMDDIAQRNATLFLGEGGLWTFGCQ